ncbi:MAG: AAA family ATPase [Phycisphaerae bacterium]|nr:AAA family ATPase [Phycisphaerae bacterium]
MLIEFSVENFLSFRERITLSMVRAASDRSSPENVIESAQGTKLNLLRSVALYGPNASGKSNLLNALRFMNWFVCNSSRNGVADGKIGVVPFKLDEACLSKPSTFEIVFLQKGVRYVYGFSVDSKLVREEWLSSYPRGQQRVLFNRGINDETGKPDYYFGPSWEGPKRQLTELTRPNALLISVGAQFNQKIAQAVHSWFSQCLRTVSWFPTMGSECAFTCEEAHEKPALRGEILQYWRMADPGIEDFVVEAVPLQENIAVSHLPDTVKRSLLEAISHAETLSCEVRAFKINAMHTGIDKRGKAGTIRFDFDEESDGTQKLFALAGPWRYVLEHGCVVVVDELDARLHPLLTRWLIQLFHRAETNPHGAQLIFATHDASLLERRPQGQPLFRRDQIWFTEKGARGGTSLYSLWDFCKPPRKEENIRLGYLAGRYGAVPFTESPVE